MLCFHFLFHIFDFPLLSQWLFRTMLFKFYLFVNFPAFLLLMISRFVPSWLEKIHGMISIYLNLCRSVLWPVICSIPENVRCALQRMCILLLSSGMFSVCVLGWFDLKYDSSQILPCWFLVCLLYSLLKVDNWSFLLLFYCLLLPSDLLSFA